MQIAARSAAWGYQASERSLKKIKGKKKRKEKNNQILITRSEVLSHSKEKGRMGTAASALLSRTHQQPFSKPRLVPPSSSAHGDGWSISTHLEAPTDPESWGEQTPPPTTQSEELWPPSQLCHVFPSALHQTPNRKQTQASFQKREFTEEIRFASRKTAISSRSKKIQKVYTRKQQQQSLSKSSWSSFCRASLHGCQPSDEHPSLSRGYESHKVPMVPST